MLHRWDIIRAIREEEEKRARKRLNIKKQTIKWIKLGLTYLMLRNIHSQFNEHLEATKLKIKKNESCMLISKNFRRYMLKVSGAREQVLLDQCMNNDITTSYPPRAELKER